MMSDETQFGSEKDSPDRLQAQVHRVLAELAVQFQPPTVDGIGDLPQLPVLVSTPPPPFVYLQEDATERKGTAASSTKGNG